MLDNIFLSNDRFPLICIFTKSKVNKSKVVIYNFEKKKKIHKYWNCIGKNIF